MMLNMFILSIWIRALTLFSSKDTLGQKKITYPWLKLIPIFFSDVVDKSVSMNSLWVRNDKVLSKPLWSKLAN